MTGRNSLRDHLLLAATMTLACYVVIYGMVFVHEMAHGGTAVALGGYFPFVELDLSGGNAIYIFPFGSAAWKEMLVLAAGPFITLVVAPVMLGLIVTGIENLHLRLLAMLLGALSSAGFVVASGLLPPGQSGDVARVLALLGLPAVYRLLIGVIWLLLGVALLASFFRLFFRELARFFPVAGYPARLMLVLSTIAAPALILIGTHTLVTAGGPSPPVRMLLIYLGIIAALSLLLPLAIRSRESDYLPLKLRVSAREIIGLLAAAAIVASLHTATSSRVDRERRGLFLAATPPEVNVSSCNVILNLNQDLRGRVVVLMRPYDEQHAFLWERIKETEPRDWAYYEQFVEQNLRLMFASGVRIVDHRTDREVPFFSSGWGTGARIVEAEVDLSQTARGTGTAGGRVLKLVDFWRSRGAGFIDLAEVNVDGGLEISDFRSQPESAGRPAFSSRTRLRWENSSFERSFAIGYLAIN